MRSVSALLVTLAAIGVAPATAPSAWAQVGAVRVRDGGARGQAVEVTTTDGAAVVAAVSVNLEGVSVEATPADLRRAGTAWPAAAPAEGDTLRVGLFAADGTTLTSFSGAVVDGRLRFGAPRAPAPTSCDSRTGCPDEAPAPDLSLRGAHLFADGSVGLDLSGADAGAVATAVFAVQSVTEGCAAYGRDGSCTAPETVVTFSEVPVSWAAPEVVWEAAIDVPAGISSLVVRAADATGGRIDRARARLTPAWADLGGGQSALPIDEDPLTSIALLGCWCGVDGTLQEASSGRSSPAHLVVVSDGWNPAAPLPAQAQLTVDDGSTHTLLPVAFQRTGRFPVDAADLADPEFRFVVDGAVGTPIAGDGGRLFVVWDTEIPVQMVIEPDDSGAWWAGVTAWAPTADAVPDTVGITTMTAGQLALDDGEVELMEELAAVFALGMEVAASPGAAALTGELRIEGAASRRGRRPTLARGRFAGQFGVDADGDLDLAPVDRRDVTASAGALMLDPTPRGPATAGDPPPPIVYLNGKGTRAVATTNNGKPNLL